MRWICSGCFTEAEGALPVLEDAVCGAGFAMIQMYGPLREGYCVPVFPHKFTCKVYGHWGRRTMNQKLEDLLQLALQTPEETREQTEELNIGFNDGARTWELIVKYHGSLDALAVLNVQIEYLIAGYAVLTVPEGLVERVAELEEIEYVEKPKRFFYEVTDPVADSCIQQLSRQDLSLTGRGVLIGVLDSGIDYRLPVFRHSDGSTRIRYLWDQTLQPEEVSAPDPLPEGLAPGVTDEPGAADEGEAGAGAGNGTADSGMPEDGGRNGEAAARRLPPAGFRQGVEFDAAQINAALQAETRQEQFMLLPTADAGGHGTAVAGIAAGYSDGGGDGLFGNFQSYRGAAPEAELLIVKLGLPDALSFPRTTEIMRGVTWAVRKALKLQMPLVLNLSFGNSYGAHDGSSLLERFLDNAAEIGRTVICVGSGNDGASAGHLAGRLGQTDGVGAGGSQPAPGGVVSSAAARTADVEIAVGEYEGSLSIQLWKNYSDVYRIRLRSPGGQESELPLSVENGKYTLRLEQTEVLVYMGEPAPYAVAQEIYLELIPAGRRYINSGVWTVRLEGIEIVTGQYYFYLPSAAARSAATGFYRPTPEVTLTIPSTAAKVITVGAYDSTYDAYADFSGRGYVDTDRTVGVVTSGLAKPDLAAPGVGVLAPDIYGSYLPVTGTSFATPIVTGAAALLMEWGIVRGNDPFLYGEKVKAYLRKGARPLRGEAEVPNARVGWGGLCVSESLPG
ncbi:MAG: S8 family serine peptidase [Firmicutes bacterium]|nr:S8 family serine peptidase [Bacillota bacterium]